MIHVACLIFRLAYIQPPQFTVSGSVGVKARSSSLYLFQEKCFVGHSASRRFGFASRMICDLQMFVLILCWCAYMHM